MEGFAGTERYQIVRRLGEGGMGVVYEAHDLERSARVALKTVQDARPRAVARFKREFRSLTDIIHPNLVNLYELVVDDDRVFYTMELVHGVHFTRWVRPTCESAVEDSSSASLDSLALSEAPADGDPITAPTRIRPAEAPAGARRALDVRRLRIAMRQLAEAVASIHEAGMLHRDLKPSNVMVTDGGRVVVLDFGLVTEMVTESIRPLDHKLEGTALFMSPEQGARTQLTPASDWYSVGVMLYVALTGRPPFLGGRDDVLMDKQRFEPPPPAQLVQDLPDDLCVLCSELLRRDPERRPNATDILRRVGSMQSTTLLLPTSVSSSLQASRPITGRDRELDALRGAWRQVVDSHAVTVRVRGPSGMGKSRLVNSFLDELGRESNTVILRGRCYESESVPFKGIDSAVDQLAQYLFNLEPILVEGLMPRDAQALARLFPVLRQVEAIASNRRRTPRTPDPQHLRRRAFIALRDLLARLSDRAPLVLAIDDLQWSDPDSASLLAALMRPPEAPRMLVVVTYRDDGSEAVDFARAFEAATRDGDADVRELEVGPLPTEAARDLALEHLQDRASPEQAETIADESRGNPFFVEELARHVRESRVGTRIRLADVLRDRLQRLPANAERLLNVVAVAARPLPPMVAFRAAGVSDPATLAILKAGSFVRSRSVGEERLIETYHDRIRSAVLDYLAPDERAECHRRLANTLAAASNPDAEALAHHYAGAGERSLAADNAARAGARAFESLAFDRAARLYRMALDLEPADQPADRTRSHRVALGDALAYAGRGAQAAEAYMAALEGAPKAESMELRAKAIAQLFYSGHIDEGLRALEDIVESVGMRLAATPRRALWSLVRGRARLLLRGLDFEAKHAREIPGSTLSKVDVSFAAAEGLGFSDTIHGADFHVRSLRLALDCGEPRRVARALAGEVAFSSLGGTRTQRRTERVLLRLQDLADRIDDPAVRAWPVGMRALAAFNVGQWRESYEGARRAEILFVEECVGMRYELATAYMYQTFALSMMGRLGEMNACFPVFVKDALERGDRYAATLLRASLGMHGPLARDDPAAAYRVIDDAMALWSNRGFHLAHANALSARVHIDLYVGDGELAFTRVEEAWPAIERSLLLRSQIMHALLWHLRGRAAMAAMAGGNRAGSRSLARSVRALAADRRVPYIGALRRYLQAGLTAARGNRERAVGLLRLAVAEARSADLGGHALAAQRALGALIGGDEGASLVEQVEERGRAEGLQVPAKMAEALCPGLAASAGLKPMLDDPIHADESES